MSGVDDGTPIHESLIGYICGSLSAAGKLSQVSMHQHDPEGDVYCIHSVSHYSCQSHIMQAGFTGLAFLHQPVCI